MEDVKNAAGVSMPHDKGYKKSLSDPGQFLHFLQKYIGADCFPYAKTGRT